MPDLFEPYLPAFYEMVDYSPVSDRKVRRNLNRERLHISEQSKPGYDLVLEYFNCLSHERIGVLHGEYIFAGHVLIRRNGTCIKANMAWEQHVASRKIAEAYKSEEFQSYKKIAISQWDNIQLVDGPPLISNPWSNNYFHWTCETMTTLRFIREDLVKTPPLFLREYLLHSFQTDVLALVIRGNVLVLDGFVKVKDPMLFYEFMSEEGVHWLRDRANITAPRGKRRVYLRRDNATSTTRVTKGGGISETEEFLAFLKEFDFEIVDFSTRHFSVEEQIALLSSASVILSPHGASLTNLVYLNPPLSVIEIMGTRTAWAMYLHIASMLGFEYYGVFSEAYDEQGNIIVDIDELSSAMRDCLG